MFRFLFPASLVSFVVMNVTGRRFQSCQEQVARPCLLSGISTPLQQHYFSFGNFVILPLIVLLSFWCFVSNGTVIVAVLRSNLARFRPGLLILCSLTLTDFLHGGLVTAPYSGFWIKELMNGKVWPNFRQLRNSLWIVPHISCFLATVGNLAVISFDRYLAVTNAIQYKSRMNCGRALVACSLIWTVSLLCGAVKTVGVMSDAGFQLILSLYVLFSAAVIVIIQILTLWRLHHNNITVANLTAETNRINPAVNAANAATERQLTVTTSYVAGFLILILFPSVCTVLVLKIIKSPIVQLLDPLISLAALINSSFNPVIYYRRNSQIRNRILNLLSCNRN